jgi:hypothetical protein
MTLTETERQLLLGVLKQVEWSGSVGIHSESCCPVCLALSFVSPRPPSHEDDCVLAKAQAVLRRGGGTTPGE